MIKRHIDTKKWIELLLAVVLPVSILIAVIAEHSSLLDHWRGLDRIQEVADNFSLSYAPDASKPVYPDDAAWKPLIELIEKYSKVTLRTDKQPLTVARIRASLSTKDEIGENRISEWTAPSTPFVVIYRHWPENTGKVFPRKMSQWLEPLEICKAGSYEAKVTSIFWSTILFSA